ncbi:MAG TPA: hypothetical protein DHU56_13465 [Marinobacter sp.]|nr:hypothetical protein [Marinobacter sp.]
MSRRSGTLATKDLMVRIITSRLVEAMVRPFLPPLLPVFMLHQFRNPGNGRPGHDPQMVSDCLARLKKQGYAFVDLDEALDRFSQSSVNRHKVVSFTLDDGFLHQVETAHEVFSAHQCPFTCFLITDFMDGKNWPWDAQVSYLLEQSNKESLVLDTRSGTRDLSLNTSANKQRAGHEIRELMKSSSARHKAETSAFLSNLADKLGVELPAVPPSPYLALGWERARELEGKGVRFGAHGLTHHILSQLGAEEAREEIVLSREKVCQELNNPSDVFCYPVGRAGDFSDRDVNVASEAGFTAAVSAVAGYVTKGSLEAGPFSLPRFTFPDSKADFLQYCSWVEYFKQRTARL